MAVDNQESPVKTDWQPPESLKIKQKHLFYFLLVLLICSIGLYYVLKSGPPSGIINPKPKPPQIQTFKSDEEFKSYIEKGSESQADFFGTGRVALPGIQADGALELSRPGFGPALDGAPERVSETNVQVRGIDEPDIVKTDGKHIYFSSREPSYILERGISPDLPTIYPPPKLQAETKIITAFPVSQLANKSSIDKGGDLLLTNSKLIVFEFNKISGFNVGDPSNPAEIWKIDLESNTQVASARLYGGKLYLVTKTGVNLGNPCPIPLMSSVGGQKFTIPCTEIYYPHIQIPADSTYTALTIDINSGNTQKTVSFVGQADTTVVYMSTDALYITYSYTGDMFEFIYGFYTGIGKALVSPEVLTKLNQLKNYDLTVSTKLTEFQIVLERYYQLLSDDERLRIENETNNLTSEYAKERARDLEKTGIVKIGLNDFKIDATGEVAGRPLNQFALDEYQKHLRIATTFGVGWWGFGSGRAESASDVYVLDDRLAVVGTVTDLGVGERIYSVRFIEDQGYVVTFKQIDPFYVLDLRNPGNPRRTGELKIPGFSSYLHPLVTNKILGVGQEGGQVKLSLFDVSDPQNPKEEDKYLLSESWTEVQNNHHAFLHDEKYQIFFLPAGQAGYIFSYKNLKLALAKVSSGYQVKRALFIDDYMYLIAADKITVFDENDWTTISELEF